MHLYESISLRSTSAIAVLPGSLAMLLLLPPLPPPVLQVPSHLARKSSIFQTCGVCATEGQHDKGSSALL